ncbi:MAG: heme exporter protein CcmB [Ignavibacteria bacterium]|nr:heme exporter protein CcmB [Ignavibacteria bacterium]
MLYRIFAVAYKDALIEFRNRYSLTTILLFTLISTTVINFSISSETISTQIYTGLLWTVIFFASMTGMLRTFVSEEEKGTVLLLKIFTTPYQVFFGKFLSNLLISSFINIAVIFMFLLFFDKIKISSPILYALTIFNGGFGIAGCSTIIGAIVAKANVKGALFPILSLPILIPLFLVAIEATNLTIIGNNAEQVIRNNLLIFSYSGLLLTISSLLFEFVWED